MIGMNPTSAWIKAALDALEKGIIDPKSVFCMIQAPAKAEESAEAYFQLARFYHHGIGCDQDDVKALEMLIKSAEGEFDVYVRLFVTEDTHYSGARKAV